MWYKNIAGRFFGLVTKHACERRTDGRTDGWRMSASSTAKLLTYNSQDHVSIAASRGKNCVLPYVSTLENAIVSKGALQMSTFTLYFFTFHGAAPW